MFKIKIPIDVYTFNTPYGAREGCLHTQYSTHTVVVPNTVWDYNFVRTGSHTISYNFPVRKAWGRMIILYFITRSAYEASATTLRPPTEEGGGGGEEGN